jgi:hypothetical protein
MRPIWGALRRIEAGFDRKFPLAVTAITADASIATVQVNTSAVAASVPGSSAQSTMASTA